MSTSVCHLIFETGSFNKPWSEPMQLDCLGSVLWGSVCHPPSLYAGVTDVCAPPGFHRGDEGLIADVYASIASTSLTEPSP